MRAATRVDGVDGKTYGRHHPAPVPAGGDPPSRGPVLAYAVTVDYYTSEPVPAARELARRQPPDVLRELRCQRHRDAPKYALITSTATQDGVVGIADTSGNRSCGRPTPCRRRR